VAELLAAHRPPPSLVAAEQAETADIRLAPTAKRSVVGVLNEFASLAEVHRADGDGLLELSLQLAATPLGPLYCRRVSSNRELAALVAERSLAFEGAELRPSWAVVVRSVIGARLW
jgi:hypothetical protein